MSLLDTPPAFTRAMKRQAIERELTYRRRVYERRISEGKMTKKAADFQIAVFEAILADYADDAAEREGARP